MPYDAITDWVEPQDTIQLCRHVLVHGAASWDVIAADLACPPALCALRWHVVWLEQYSSTVPIKPQKCYSDWELCVLMLAHQHGTTSCLKKRDILKSLSRWVPGRTAVGLKQAHSTHVQGSEHKVMVKLRNNSWPENLTDLLSAWPGPQTGHMAQQHVGVQAVAQQVLDAIQSTQTQVTPTITSKQPSRKRQHCPAPSTATAVAAAAANAAAGASLVADSSSERCSKQSRSNHCMAGRSTSESMDQHQQPPAMQQQLSTEREVASAPQALPAAAQQQQQQQQMQWMQPARFSQASLVFAQDSPAVTPIMGMQSHHCFQPHQEVLQQDRLIVHADGAAAAAAAAAKSARADAGFEAILMEALAEVLLEQNRPVPQSNGNGSLPSSQPAERQTLPMAALQQQQQRMCVQPYTALDTSHSAFQGSMSGLPAPFSASGSPPAAAGVTSSNTGAQCSFLEAAQDAAAARSPAEAALFEAVSPGAAGQQLQPASDSRGCGQPAGGVNLMGSGGQEGGEMPSVCGVPPFAQQLQEQLLHQQQGGCSNMLNGATLLHLPPSSCPHGLQQQLVPPLPLQQMQQEPNSQGLWALVAMLQGRVAALEQQQCVLASHIQDLQGCLLQLSHNTQ